MLRFCLAALLGLLADWALAASSNNGYVEVRSDTPGVVDVVPVGMDFHITTTNVPDTFKATVTVSPVSGWDLRSPDPATFQMAVGGRAGYEVRNQSNEEDEASGDIFLFKVDVEIAGVGEDKEETEGAFAVYADCSQGYSDPACVAAMKPVKIRCLPAGRPADETIDLTFPAGHLLEKVGTTYQAAQSSYKANEIGGKSFWLHGHAASGAVRDYEIKAEHNINRSKDEAKYSVLKTDSVEAYCGKFGASGSFGANPEIFPGGQTDFGKPDQPPPYWWLPGTYANPSSKVLKVFFKYIKGSNDEPEPFDIDLKANILPDTISDDALNISWYKWAGPSSSGSFDKTDEREVKFQNPTKGGLYKFRMEMNPGGFIIASDAWVLLPKAGGEISSWMASEVPSLVTRASNWETDVRAVAVAHRLDEDEFVETAWKAIATCDFDYQGIVGDPTKRYSFTDADRPAGHMSDPDIPGMAGKKGNGDWDEPSYATLAGIVIHRAKINNAMYAVWGRELGYTEFELKGGAFWNAMGRGLWDDSTSQNAVELGSDLYDAHSSGGSLSAILTKTRSKDIHSPDSPSGLNDVNLWPDTTPVSSGFLLPTMPTDYDSLDEGENEMPRGRLFQENLP